MTTEPRTLSWHQREGLRRALALHKPMATDAGVECIRCGATGVDDDALPARCGPDPTDVPDEFADDPETYRMIRDAFADAKARILDDREAADARP